MQVNRKQDAHLRSLEARKKPWTLNLLKSEIALDFDRRGLVITAI